MIVITRPLVKARVKWGKRTSSIAHPRQGQARAIICKYVMGVEGNGVVLSPMAKQKMESKKERRDSKTKKWYRNVHKNNILSKSSKIKGWGYVVQAGPDWQGIACVVVLMVRGDESGRSKSVQRYAWGVTRGKTSMNRKVSI